MSGPTRRADSGGHGENGGVLRNQGQALWEEGAIFAFGLSERDHGANLYSIEMKLTPADGGYVTNGSKYCIGNGNQAA